MLAQMERIVRKTPFLSLSLSYLAADYNTGVVRKGLSIGFVGETRDDDSIYIADALLVARVE